jgi:hypothetical protein
MKNVFATMLLIGASHALAGTIVSQGDTPAIPTASIYRDELNESKVVAWQTGSYGYDNVHIQVVIAGLAKDIGKFGAIFSSTLSTSLGFRPRIQHELSNYGSVKRGQSESGAEHDVLSDHWHPARSLGHRRSGSIAGP